MEVFFILEHPFDPVYNEESRVLILGSFPSEKSRESGFYYGHPQNRFWRVIARVFGHEEPKGIDEKQKFLLDKRLALWDVVKSCEITGSSDLSIRNPSLNDILDLLKKTRIERVFANGGAAGALYKRFAKIMDVPSITVLPSTSSANVGYSVLDLVAAWEQIRS